MVKLCTKEYERNSEYENYFNYFPFKLSDFQKYAIEGIVRSEHVLVTAHTGSGKTLPAEFAIQYFVKHLNRKVIYTSPIKALSNQKFYEFSKKFPDIEFGILTGDIKFNPEADVLIMTTEILQNNLFNKYVGKEDNSDHDYLSNFNIDYENELACVIFDEVHYINDEDRGKVWEQTIMMLPNHVQMIMLSATIDKPDEFAKWCESQQLQKSSVNAKEVYLIPTNHRVVPLYHHLFLDSTQSIFKSLKDKELKDKIKSIIGKPHLLKSPEDKFNIENYNKIKNIKSIMEKENVIYNPDLY